MNFKKRIGQSHWCR